MAYQYATNGGTVPYKLGQVDSLLVPLGVSVLYGDPTGNAISGSGSGQTVSVYGLVASNSEGISLSNISTGILDQVFIGTQGVVDSLSTSIDLGCLNSTVDNYGLIVSHSDAAIRIEPFLEVSFATVRNYGEIRGYKQAIVEFDAIIGNYSVELQIYNFGRIVSPTIAISAGIARDIFQNRGTVQGVVDLGGGDNRILNRGLIIGDVHFDTGSDLLDNRGGTIEGTITFGGGDDRFLPGASSETADGGAGIDTLDFSKSAGVHLALDGLLDGTGWANDDAFTGFENLIGSVTGNDILTGDSAANMISGGGGDDVLSGLAGQDGLAGGRGDDVLTGGADADTLSGGSDNDTLIGGAGRDSLIGGTGADKFRFGPADFAGLTAATADVIQDFNAFAKDRIDLKGIDANSAKLGDQPFTFIGSERFHNAPGELRYQASAGGLLVLGDINGDGTAEFAIFVARVTGLAAGDFVL